MSKIIDGKKYYTVRFLNHAGNDLLKVIDLEENGDATRLAPNPENIDGMDFVGWNVDITCIKEDITVRGVYKSKSEGKKYYTVRFLNYAGNDLLKVIDVEENGDATRLAPKPENIEGMDFVGWNVDITCIKEDITVRGVYKSKSEEKKHYTVKFLKYKSDDVLKVVEVQEGEDATRLAPKPEDIEDMDFVGWNANITCIKGDITVRAVYESKIKSYIVRFLNYEGNDVLLITEVKEGQSAIPPTPERINNKIFIGWNTSFSNVKEDKTIKPIYRDVPPHPIVKFYKRNKDNTTGNFIKSYNSSNDCRITSRLNGECTMTFKTLTRKIDSFVDVNSIAELDGLVFYITNIKKNISSGVCYTEMEFEHISYILNDEKYKVTAFDMTGSVRDILFVLLKDTPFNVGDVDFHDEVTLKVNQNATRRACIMQLLALVKGEIEYYGYTIGIRKHKGNSNAIDIMKTENVKDISYSYNKIEHRYSYSIGLYKKKNIDLGDEILIDFKPLSVYREKRIVEIEWNPFNYNDVNITVGAYIPTINDALYSKTTTVEDITTTSAKYTLEFGEIIGEGTFYFTRSYNDRPYFHYQTSDGSKPKIRLNRKGTSDFSSYVGATISGVKSDTSTVVSFYCTLPVQNGDYR